MNSEPRYLNLYFQVHQPRRLKRFQFFDIGSGVNYFDDNLNASIMRRIATECYLPANRILLELIQRHPEVKITFSISGVALEQFQQHAPAVIHSFRRLAETGSVEFLSETYYHSLAYFIERDEFVEQIALHRKKMRELIGVTPSFFRNTELIYSDSIGKIVADLGFAGMFIDGIDNVLKGRTPNALYRHPTEEFALFPRNFQLSDDIAFRYSDRNWSEWPLTGEKFAGWLAAMPPQEKFVCLAMDYETFGEHKKEDSGIFAFLEDLILHVLRHRKFTFVTPTEAAALLPAREILSSERAISWADEARDLSAWLGNPMQRDAFDCLYRLHDAIIANGNAKLIEIYRHLQASDHFYYMCTKKDQDGAVHQYFSPYASPYEAFMNFMNIVTDLELRVKRSELKVSKLKKVKHEKKFLQRSGQ